MTRRLRNWTYRDLKDFLRENEFRFVGEIKGSHQAWGRGKEGQSETIVKFNFTHKSYPIGTFKQIIRQTGILEKRWIDWANS